MYLSKRECTYVHHFPSITKMYADERSNHVPKKKEKERVLAGDTVPAAATSSSKESKSLEFLTQTLAEVGFSPAHAQRACLATNLAGVPQVS
jgi:Holliday junction resolvasome RuvABC DNA-binding subunit